MQQFTKSRVYGFIHRGDFLHTFLKIINMRLSNAVCPQPFLKIHRIHSHYLLETYRNRCIFVFHKLLFCPISIHSKQRTCSYDVISAIKMEIFQRAPRTWTILYLIKNKTSFTVLNLHMRHSGSQPHDYRIDLQIRDEEFLIIRMFTKIKIYYILEMLFCKIDHTACLATLADTFHYNRLMRGILQP